MSLEDAFDLTRQLRDAARAELLQYKIGPLYTPPSLQGTIMRPGIIGGANWGGGAFDPDTGTLFVKSSNLPHLARIGRPDRSANNPRASEVDAEYVREGTTNAEFMNGIPLTKPPYGHLSAIELNRGEIAWRVPFGDSPSLRNNPALKGIALSPLLGATGNAGAIVTKGGLIFVGGGDAAFHAVDKTNGQELWKYPLTHSTSGTPMTYRGRDGRQFVVIATGSGNDNSLLAFALPQ